MEAGPRKRQRGTGKWETIRGNDGLVIENQEHRTRKEEPRMWNGEHGTWIEE